MGQVIGHLDANCFYVSAERVRYDHLAGAPVGVLGNQGACVIAKSYGMKADGVKTGDPIWEAIQKMPPTACTSSETFDGKKSCLDSCST